MSPIKLSYYALVVAICCSCTPETAFEKLQHERPSEVRAQLSLEDLQDMRRMKAAGYTYKQLGELYGMHPDAVYGRLRHLPRQTA